MENLNALHSDVEIKLLSNSTVEHDVNESCLQFLKARQQKIKDAIADCIVAANVCVADGYAENPGTDNNKNKRLC